jgi:Na+-translocating ferredoxin:NAD+ oxidoreductase RnfG subunit
MQKEIIVVIIASIATFIVAVINVIFSKGIASKQNDIELKKTRIELLESRRIAIEKINTEMKNVRMINFDKILKIINEEF